LNRNKEMKKIKIVVVVDEICIPGLPADRMTKPFEFDWTKDAASRFLENQ